MKKSILLFLFILAVHMLHAQNEDRKIKHIILATYDGKSELGYRFINRLNEAPITFPQIELGLLQNFKLNDDSLMSSTFKITYGIEKYYPKGKDGQNSLPFKEQLIILNLEQIE